MLFLPIVPDYSKYSTSQPKTSAVSLHHPKTTENTIYSMLQQVVKVSIDPDCSKYYMSVLLASYGSSYLRLELLWPMVLYSSGNDCSETFNWLVSKTDIVAYCINSFMS